MLAGNRDLAATREHLQNWLRGRMPQAEDLVLSDLKKPSAGLSNETLLFETSSRERGQQRTEKLVARLQPTEFQVFPEYDLGLQYRILEALTPTDVPVPSVRWYERERSVLGCEFYVMEHVAGEIPSEVPPYHCFGLCFDATEERRARMWWDGVDMLARIHALDCRSLGLSFLGVPSGGTDPIDRQIAYWERYLAWARAGTAQPILEATLEWLKANRYTPQRVSLCWGDARMPNMMFRDDRVVAVLDWEMAWLGDPEADLGWWLFHDWASSEGYGFPRLAGFPSKEETIRRYEEQSGFTVEHALYQEVFAAFRFGAIMARIALRLKEIGLPTPVPDFESNNVATQALARLLDLPPPGVRVHGGNPATGVRRVQIRLTGPGGGNWWVESSVDGAARHEGTVAAADVTVNATAADWEAIQSGALSRTEAFFSGRLKIDGDTTVLLALEDAISKLSK